LENLQRKKPLGRLWLNGRIILNLTLKGKEYKDMNWIYMAQYRVNGGLL
jgi:hypothetical protein